MACAEFLSFLVWKWLFYLHNKVCCIMIDYLSFAFWIEKFTVISRRRKNGHLPNVSSHSNAMIQNWRRVCWHCATLVKRSRRLSKACCCLRIVGWLIFWSVHPKVMRFNHVLGLNTQICCQENNMWIHNGTTAMSKRQIWRHILNYYYL